MFKSFKKVATLSLAALALIACTNNTSQSSQQGNNSVADKSQEIVIYTNSSSNGRGEWLKEKAAQKGYKLQIVDMAGSEIADRLIAEKNNAVADLVFGANNLEFNRIKAQNLLVEYKPSWSSDVDSSLGDSQGYFYPIVVQPLVLIANAKAKLPSDWTELASPEYKNMYAISELSTGTSKNIFASIVSRYADANGDLGISKEGWRVAKDYLQNAHIIAKGEDYISPLIDDNNPLNYSMMWGSGVLQYQKERQYTFQVMTPEIGVPYVTEQIGILSTSKKQALLKEFVEWFGSDTLQKEWSDKFGTIPANKKALEQTKDEIKQFANSVNPQQIDWEFVGKNIDAWVEKAQLELIK